VSGQRSPFLVCPAFLGILRFKGPAKYIFNARIATAGKAFINEGLKVRWDVLP
jgi:hypothetical protein